MKKIVILVLSVFAILQANAVVVQKVYLKNGTVLNGYIQQQDKSDNITFRSENAIICIPGKNATITERVYKLDELNNKWIEWAEKNEAFNGTGNARTLTLNEIIFKKDVSNEVEDSIAVFETDDKDGKSQYFENEFSVHHTNVVKVKILEKGVNIRYLELTPNTYTFKWSDVDNIEADKRPKELLSGIDRVYQLKNGQEITGQYAGESENTLSLYTGKGMVKETYDIDNVTKYLFKAVNPNQSIFEQSELLDVVKTKKYGTYRGVIVERNFLEGNNYLVIMQQGGSSQMLKFSEVTQYGKEENHDYKPKMDILLKEGEVVINRIPTDSVGVTKNSSNLILDSINQKVVVPKEGETTKIFVEYNNPRHLSSDHLLLVKADKSVVKKKTVYGFSTDIYEMKKYAAQSIETSINNTTRIEYVISGQGVFILYDQNNKKAMPFIVK